MSEKMPAFYYYVSHNRFGNYISRRIDSANLVKNFNESYSRWQSWQRVSKDSCLDYDNMQQTFMLANEQRKIYCSWTALCFPSVINASVQFFFDCYIVE